MSRPKKSKPTSFACGKLEQQGQIADNGLLNLPKDRRAMGPWEVEVQLQVLWVQKVYMYIQYININI